MEENKISDGFFSVSSQEGPEVPAPSTPEHATDEQRKLVTLIEAPYPAKSLQNLLKKCNFCIKGKVDRSYFDLQSACGYYKLKYVYPTCCKGRKDFKLKVADNGFVVQDKMEVKLKESEKGSDALKVTSGGIKVGVLSDDDDEMMAPMFQPKSNEVHQKEENLNVVAKAKVEQKVEQILVQDVPKVSVNIEVKPTPTMKPRSASEQASSQQRIIEPSISIEHRAETKQSTPTIVSSQSASVEVVKDISETVTVLDTASEGVSTSDCNQSGGPSCTLGPDVVQIRPPSTEEIVPTPSSTIVVDSGTQKMEPPYTENIPVKQDKPVSNGVLVNKQQEVKINKTVLQTNGNGMKDIYAEKASIEKDEFELEMVLPPSMDEPVHKLSSTKKQTIFMTLKNKIKALELNLNLSSRSVLSQCLCQHFQYRPGNKIFVT